MNLKLKFSVTAAILGISLLAFSQSVPSYTTLSGTGTSSVILNFPTSPSQQVRVVSAVGTSDLAGSVFTFTTGTTPASISYSNAAAQTVITVAATNGLAASQVLFIEGKNGVTNLTISFIAYTNITLANKVGFVTLPGDEVYVMSGSVTLPVGAATVSYQGMALYAGNRGRPVSVTLNGTSAATISAVTARYE